MTTPSFFAIGGAVMADAKSYVVRKSDQILYDNLRAGEYCHVLTSRQMGKTSVAKRVVDLLRHDGLTVVFMDLNRIGTNAGQLKAEEWYDFLMVQIGRETGLQREVEDFWYQDETLLFIPRLHALFELLLLPRLGELVIFIDEIDLVKSFPFSTDDFFLGIRSIYNARDEKPIFQQLRFCFLGATLSIDLIKNKEISPFNVGKIIILEDFNLKEMELFKTVFSGEDKEKDEALKRVFYWTNGQPFLTQLLCKEIVENGEYSIKEIDAICQRLFFCADCRETNHNLSGLIMFLEGVSQADEEIKSGMLDLYGRVLRGKTIKHDEFNPHIPRLRLMGLVKLNQNGVLQVRNRIYARAFNSRWIWLNLPGAEKRRQEAARRRGFWQAFAASSVVVTITGGLAIWGWTAEQEAVKQRDIASQQKEIALEAIHTLTYQLVDGLKNIPRTQPIVEKTLQGNVALLERIYALDSEKPEALREKASNLSRTGDMWLRFGKIDEAVVAFQQYLEIAERLAASDPTDAQAQRDLSVSYEKIGNVQLRLGNANDALRAYQQTHDILKRLAASDPTDAQAQRDLSISYNKIGDVQLRLGQAQDALQAYQQSLEIRQRLAASDPTDAQAQRDLSISHERIGDVQLRLGNANDALRAYQQSLEIRQRLAASDPTDAQAQSDLAWGYTKIGDVQLRLGNANDALRTYQQDFEISERLAASDPTDAQAQRDLSISYNKIGDVQLRLGNANDALRAYQQSLEICERLAASDPTDAQAQSDLSNTLNSLGFTIIDREMKDHYTEAHGLLKRALELEPDSPYIVDSMGWLFYRMGKYPEALEYLQRAMELVEKTNLAEQDPYAAAENALHLGEVLWAMDRREEAKQIWGNAVKQFPDDVRLKEAIKRL
ncbi:AAA-like domain-containing protein [Thioflexithrix psekupsensis]|uniref:Tetratricopeptide repeat protein n=1 Tax=Thioflexithrix psekupsensis TaxID=1570016 RepID=A0A251XBH7_9GAMM|nr:AAA-like domain-containing protein [Thioflexithrix psekupsensis]OUD15658.1 hypothetical protein TPSD3_03825 [Thioflexithrix psekupsensis]